MCQGLRCTTYVMGHHSQVSNRNRPVGRVLLCVGVDSQKRVLHITDYNKSGLEARQTSGTLAGWNWNCHEKYSRHQGRSGVTPIATHTLSETFARGYPELGHFM